MSELSVFFVGTTGSVPSAARGLPATLIRRDGDQLLFDCGEGTQRQLLRSVGLPELDCIFLTHYHADHWLGLPGMLKTFDMRGRERPLTVYGPPGLNDLIRFSRSIYGEVAYPLEFQELQPNEAVRRGDYQVVPVEVDHRGVAYGYALVEDGRPGKFDPEQAKQLGVTSGRDFGRLQRGETVNGVTPDQVMGEPRLGRKVVLSGDTKPSNDLSLAAYKADLLIHEATFTEQEAARAAQTKHSTSTQAAEFARQAEVEMLALVHISSRYTVREIRKPAEAIFKNTVVPRDFDTVELPFPERGKPKLIRWDELKESFNQPVALDSNSPQNAG